MRADCISARRQGPETECPCGGAYQVPPDGQNVIEWTLDILVSDDLHAWVPFERPQWPADMAKLEPSELEDGALSAGHTYPPGAVR